MTLRQTIFKKLALMIIRFYQKFISPYKGFKCAHGHYLQGLSCSAYGLWAFQNHTPSVALKKTKERLHACHIVYHLHQKPYYQHLLHQGEKGMIDCDCDSSCFECSFFSCEQFSNSATCKTLTVASEISDCLYLGDERKKHKKNNTTSKTSFREQFTLIVYKDNYDIYQDKISKQFYKIDNTFSWDVASKDSFGHVNGVLELSVDEITSVLFARSSH